LWKVSRVDWEGDTDVSQNETPPILVAEQDPGRYQAVDFSEKLVHICQATWHCILEYRNLSIIVNYIPRHPFARRRWVYIYIHIYIYTHIYIYIYITYKSLTNVVTFDTQKKS